MGDVDETGGGGVREGGKRSAYGLNAVLLPTSQPPLKNIFLYMGKRGRRWFIFTSFPLLIMAGSGIKRSFVSREAISKRLVWSFPRLVMTEENE